MDTDLDGTLTRTKLIIVLFFNLKQQLTKQSRHKRHLVSVLELAIICLWTCTGISMADYPIFQADITKL